ncbi:polysaccharide pyruvyl transferase family protein [Synechococcus sp. AH-601-J22]|nr:polysaccharide pyruvyl transferase family protein [Synechococcus sp. AH-601-J22]
MYYLHFDPSICSPNIGDQIISQAVESILSTLLPDLGSIKFPTQYSSLIRSHRILESSQINIVGGTNLITPNRLKFSQWKIPISFYIKNYKFLLLGVGIHQYKNKFDPLSSFAYRRLLRSKYLHSVRDSYTQRTLESLKISSINTSCPTLWPLIDDASQAKIPTVKSASVVFTLTDYRKSPVNDIKLIQTLISIYSNVYFWPQGTGDQIYCTELLSSIGKTSSVSFLPFGLTSYTDLLRCSQLDYVGTRLHAGIYALNHFKRSLVLSVDNRAAEIGKDINLPVIARDEINSISNFIQTPSPLRLQLPTSNVVNWCTRLRLDMGLDTPSSSMLNFNYSSSL